MKPIFRTASFAVTSLCIFAAGVQAAPLFAAETATPEVVTIAPQIENAPAEPAVPPVEPILEAPLPSETPKSLAALVAAQDIAGALSADEDCLAGAIYFESRSEALVGQHAVAAVIINRASSGRFPTTLCGVVKQRGQFSFVRGGVMPAIPKASRDWREAVAIAKIAMAEGWESAAPKALFFHAKRVSPSWRLKRVGTVGNHVFYR